MLDKSPTLIDAVRRFIRTKFGDGRNFMLGTVLQLARKLESDFPAHESEASQAGVMRRMLQDERDLGVLEFHGRGSYSYIPSALAIQTGALPISDASTATAVDLVLHSLKKAPTQPVKATRVADPANDDLFGERFAKPVQIAKLGGKDGRKGRVKVADLHLDTAYQYRPEDEPGRIAQLEKWIKARGGFDPIEAGAIHVNRRSNGRLFIIDGGGRTWMARRAGAESIDVVIYEGLTWDEEKAFFLRKNQDKRTIRAPHIFHVTGSSGVEPHATICKLLDETQYGLERMKGDGGRALFAPSSLLHVFYLDGTGDILRLTLHDLRKAIGDHRLLDGRLLVAVGMLRFCGAGREQARLRQILTHNTIERGNPVTSLDELFVLARRQASDVITSRMIQSRDLNPFLFRVLANRFNYSKHTEYRIDVAAVNRAKEVLSTPEIVARWGERTIMKDTWSWKYFS